MMGIKWIIITIVWVCIDSVVCFYFQQLQTKKRDQLDSNDSELFQSKLVGKGVVIDTYKNLSAETGFNELDCYRYTC